MLTAALTSGLRALQTVDRKPPQRLRVALLLASVRFPKQIWKLLSCVQGCLLRSCSSPVVAPLMHHLAEKPGKR